MDKESCLKEPETKKNRHGCSIHIYIEMTLGPLGIALLKNLADEVECFPSIVESAEKAALGLQLPFLLNGRKMKWSDFEDECLVSMTKQGFWEESKETLVEIGARKSMRDNFLLIERMEKAKRAYKRNKQDHWTKESVIIYEWIPSCLWMMNVEDVPYWLNKTTKRQCDTSTVRKCMKKYGLLNYASFGMKPIITGFKTRDCPYVFDVKWKKLDPTLSGRQLM